jgi:hypothetical protein
MAIGVFIAPNLLYWEALSSEDPAKARFSQAELPAPKIPPSLAISGLDNERIFVEFEKLIPVSCAGRDPTTYLAQVNVEDSILFHSPSAGKFQNQLSAAGHFARKSAVSFKGIVATLELVGIPPVAD